MPSSSTSNSCIVLKVGEFILPSISGWPIVADTTVESEVVVEEGAGVMAVVADTKDDTVVTEGVTVTVAWVDGVAVSTASDDGVTVTVPAGVEDEVHVHVAAAPISYPHNIMQS